ncbi:S8 family serine peptidase [Nocardioides sp.]|uniref:S8 family serine peptidase n=1 Tax=Nocardioides sp. TaxID=35761 RepID=UPI003784704D
MSITARPGARRRLQLLVALGAGALTLGAAATVTSPATAAPQGAHRFPPSAHADIATAGVDVPPRLGAGADHGRHAYLLELQVASTTQAFHRRGGSGAGPKAAARQQLVRVTAAQRAVIGRLPAHTPVLYRTHAAMAGVAVTTDAANYGKLARIPGVAAVYPITPKSYDNSYAVPLQGAPQGWEGNGDLGQDTTVAVLDTGIDYTHANFGGPGTVEAYDAEHAHADDPTLWDDSIFPTDKVIGGYDLVGDAYDADPQSDTYDPVPVPDPNPLDCEGHGSHVAGSAAGYGENADGSTYDGSYDTGTPFDSMRIGPGMAPQAKLYAFRVFGCDGSTDVVGDAIDMALDPNGDGDPSDHVDVINMSLGSDFGSPQDGDAVMADDAAAAGVTLAISSGNAYDLYDVGGSPGTSQKAITVAASIDAQSVVDGLDLDIDGSPSGPLPAERSALYDWSTMPDLGGEVVDLGPDVTGCEPFDEDQAAAIDGKVVILKWTDDDLECGSITRSGNVADAGGIGFIFASNKETFSAGINGSDVIPGVLVNKSAGEQIRSAIVDGVTVTGTEANAVEQSFPADDDKMTDFSSRGIRGAGHLKPDVTAVGGTVFSTAVGTGTEGQTESGTSMAAPMVAGLAALVLSEHPDWTPEQVKADIMNTAGQDLFTGDDHSGDRYAPNRVGAGRIQAAAALENDVLAYVTNDPGAVSVSFGPRAISAPTTLSKTVKVQNTGLTKRTFDVSYDAITEVPGVSYAYSPSSVTLSPRGSATVTVTMSVPDPSALTKTVDPTHGGGPAQFLADASGNLVLSPEDDGIDLRVPVYSAPRPASDMTQDAALTLPRGDRTSAVATLSGTGVDQGVDEENVTSLASGFELQLTSPKLPACSGGGVSGCVLTSNDKAADLRYVGYTSDAPYMDPDDAMAYFAVSSRGAHGTAAGQAEYDLYLDTDRDGEPDLVAYNGRVPDTDLMVTWLIDLQTGETVDGEYTNILDGGVDTATYDSDVLVMPVWLGVLADYGVDADNPRVDYALETYSASSGALVDEAGWGKLGVSGALSADLYTPGVSVVDQSDPFVLAVDADDHDLTVTRDASSYADDHGTGLLMVHFHNAVGAKAQVVKLKTKQMQSSISLQAPSMVKARQRISVTATVATKSGVTPTGTVTIRSLPTNKVLGTGTLRNGTVTVSFTKKKPRVLTIKAVYGGDVNYLSRTSAEKSITIVKKRG